MIIRAFYYKLFVILHKIPDKKEKKRDCERYYAESIFPQPGGEMGQLEMKGLRMNKGDSSDIEPSKKSENKKCKRCCLKYFLHKDTRITSFNQQ